MRRKQKTDMKKITGWLLFMLFINQAPSFGQDNDNERTGIDIIGGFQRKLVAVSDSQEYKLYIHLPGGYERSNQRYPVIYVLDAQWDYALVTTLYGQQYYDGFMPAAIVVGITWGGQNTDYLRSKYFTPTHVGDATRSGHGPDFLSFLKTQVIPFIDSSYRSAKDDRTLMGSSLAGLFTTYAFFAEPSLFSRYVLTSPSLWWDDQYIIKKEKQFAAKRAATPARLFMAMGELEGGEGDFARFETLLRSKTYKGLQLETRIIKNGGHSSSKAEGYARGLQFAFARPDIKLAPGIIDQYTGKYLFGQSDTIRIRRENSRLVGFAPDGTRFVFNAVSEAEFYVPGQFVNIRFRKDASGKTEGFQLERYEGAGFVRKIN
jgi:predicted alpha/beta superfamily hydrolase